MATEEVVSGVRHGPGYVYFIARHGLVKIGMSIDPEGRARDLGLYIGRPELLGSIRTADMYRLERYFHRAYSDCCSHGEWFRLPASELLMLTAITTADSPDDLPEFVLRRHDSQPPDATYTQVKVDDELTPRIRAAVGKLSLAAEEAGKKRVSVQEYISDLLNADTARVLGLKPIKRRPPPPPPKGKPRPR